MTVRESAEKILKTAKMFRLILCILWAVYLCAMLILHLLDKSVIFAKLSYFAAVLGIVALVYLVRYLPFERNIKWLKSKGYESALDEINPGNFTLPKSQIYCGPKALATKKGFNVIPYSEIAWLYRYERRRGYRVIEEAIIIYTKDGKKFKIHADLEEIKWLLGNIIVKYSPDVTVGFGKEQRKRYSELYPEGAKKANRPKMIWGIILISVGAFYIIGGLINNTLDTTIMVIGGIFTALGAVLLIFK